MSPESGAFRRGDIAAIDAAVDANRVIAGDNAIVSYRPYGAEIAVRDDVVAADFLPWSVTTRVEEREGGLSRFLYIKVGGCLSTHRRRARLDNDMEWPSFMLDKEFYRVSTVPLDETDWKHYWFEEAIEMLPCADMEIDPFPGVKDMYSLGELYKITERNGITLCVLWSLDGSKYCYAYCEEEYEDSEAADDGLMQRYCIPVCFIPPEGIGINASYGAMAYVPGGVQFSAPYDGDIFNVFKKQEDDDPSWVPWVRTRSLSSGTEDERKGSVHLYGWLNAKAGEPGGQLVPQEDETGESAKFSFGQNGPSSSLLFRVARNFLVPTGEAGERTDWHLDLEYAQFSDSVLVADRSIGKSVTGENDSGSISYLNTKEGEDGGEETALRSNTPRVVCIKPLSEEPDDVRLCHILARRSGCDVCYLNISTLLDCIFGFGLFDKVMYYFDSDDMSGVTEPGHQYYVGYVGDGLWHPLEEALANVGSFTSMLAEVAALSSEFKSLLNAMTAVEKEREDFFWDDRLEALESRVDDIRNVDFSEISADITELERVLNG